MKLVFKNLYFTLFALLLCQSILAQEKVSLAEMAKKNAKLVFDVPSEKVYLHFDKPYYAVGDTIWFKGYVTLENQTPSPLSKILYVDLINEKDSLVESLKLPVTNAVATGSFMLGFPDFKEGNYHVRAYTKWMLNKTEAYFFKRNIVWVGILFVLGVGLGFYLDKTTKVYEHQIIVTPNFGSNSYLYSKVNLLKSKIAEEDTVFLKNIGFKNVKDISKIEIKPIKKII